MATGGDLGIFVCLSTWSTLKGQKTSKSAFLTRYTENPIVGQYTIASNVDEEKCDGNRVA